MGKKRTLAIILLLCVLGGLIACGRKEKEDEYTYTIKLNDNASGSKQFSSCGYLWVYSVTDQMFTKYGNGEMPAFSFFPYSPLLRLSINTYYTNRLCIST